MSRGNQRVQLPQIKQENYNFVTSKKKTVQFQQPLPQDDFMEDWKKKCEDLQRDVETRNQTIFSIQRNFESLSAILKNEKQENMGIKDEVMRLRELLQQQQSQERENQFKIAEGVKRIKELTQYQELLGEERKVTQKQSSDITILKNQITQLEAIIQRKEGEIRQLSSNLSSLQGDLTQLPHLLDENTKLKQELIKCKELIVRHEKSIADKELNLQVAFQNNTQLNSLIENLKLDFGAAQGTIRHLKSEENISLAKIAKQQQELAELHSQLKTLQDQLSNQNTLLLTRNQQDGQQNQIIVALQREITEQQKQYQVILQENKNLSDFINDNMPIIEQYQQVLSVYGETDFLELIKEYQRSQQECKIKQDKLETTQQELLKVSQKTSNAQAECAQLINQVNELQQQNKDITQKCQLFEEEVRIHQSMKSSSVNSEQMIKNLSTQLKHKSENEIALLQQIKNIQSQLTKYNEYDGLIISYKKYTQPVEFILTSELNEFKENIQQLTQSNKLYLEDIERRNQQMQELNSKLTDMETLNNSVKTLENDANQLKTKLEQAHALLDEVGSDRKKYKMRIDTLESQLSGANQENRNLGKQIGEQTEHIQSLTTKYQTLQREHKDIQDQNFKMGLDIKNLTAKCKKSEEELELLNPDKMRGLQSQLEQKEKEFQSQLSNISLALDSQITSISCNSCMEVMQKSVTCYPCGHSFCEKCFKNECSECQDQDGWFKNKRLDDLISKINYSKEILNTYKKKQ